MPEFRNCAMKKDVLAGKATVKKDKFARLLEELQKAGVLTAQKVKDLK